MAGSSAKTTASNASRARKRVEAESAVLKRARDGSAFTRCEACNKNVPVVLIDMHSCSLDSKIRMNLEAQVVEKAVEISKTERKRLASSAGKGRSAKKGKTGGGGAKKGGKRPQTAFFLFMADFRKEYKAAHPDSKNVAAVAKEGGERWKSMTDEEKKPYLDKAAELKAQYENGEGSGENKVAGKEEEQEQEVDQPGKPGPYDDSDDEDDDDYTDDNDEAQKPEDEKNELDDDSDDDM